MNAVPDPDPSFHIDVDPDPNFAFPFNPNPDLDPRVFSPVEGSVADPHHLYICSSGSFHIDADPDPDLEPAHRQSYANLRPLINSSMAPF